MVLVKLIKDVAEGGVEFVEGGVDVNRKPLRLKITAKKGADGKVKVTPFVKGAVVFMHEASAAKWVKRGLGKVENAATA